METLKQCSERVWQLQSRIAELERENARLQAENIHLQAENQTLRASSARFRAVFEQSPLSIQMLSPDGRIQQVNRAWEQLFDSTPREIGDYNMLAKQVMTLIERGLAGEVVILPPIRYDVGQNVAGGADGRAPWAHGILYPIKDEVGHVVEVVLVHQDTTDWLRVEQTRREAEAEKQAAILLERERAALERVAELAKANDTLSQTLEVLATDSDLNNFVGHVLKVIAQQLDAPLTEYWFHPEPGNISYLGLSCLRGKILTPEEQLRHPGVVGFPVPPEMIHNESLHHRQRHFEVENVETNRFHVQVSDQIGVDVGAWYAARGVRRHINIPVVLSDRSIGALLVFLAGDRSFTHQQIELAYALAKLVTLAIQITKLAEQDRLAAIAKEQEKAALERAAELTELNAALSASEARLRTLFEQIPVSLQIFSSSGVCLEVNRAWSELWQLPSLAVIGKSCLVTSENPSSQLPSPFTPYLQRCFAGEPVVVPPLWFDPVTTFKVGRARWVQTYIYPIKDQANGLREVLLIHQDIHALKQASEVALGQTEALIQVLSALVSSPDIDQLLAKVISITTAQLNAPASTLWLCDTQTSANKLHLVCCGDQVSRELPVRMRADIDSLCLLSCCAAKFNILRCLYF